MFSRQFSSKNPKFLSTVNNVLYSHLLLYDGRHVLEVREVPPCPQDDLVVHFHDPLVVEEAGHRPERPKGVGAHHHAPVEHQAQDRSARDDGMAGIEKRTNLICN